MLSIRRCRSAFASGRPFCITAEYICRFASKYRRTTPSHVAQASLDRVVRRTRRTRDDRLSSQRVEDLADSHGRGASDQEMIAVDEKIDRAANKLRRFAQRAAAEGGFAAKLAQPLADDAEFLRRLKPSLIRARVKGRAPTNAKPAHGTVPAPSAPSEPQLEPRPAGPRRDGPNPWV